jgi:phenylalanyl-tRNA synthetase beta chain
MELQLEGKTAGFFGELAPEYSAKWRNAAPVFFAQIDFAKLLAAAEHSSKSYKELPQYPGTARDIAFVAPADLESGTVLDFLRRCKVANLESVRLFDIFVDDALKAQGKKSMAYSLNFRNKERTLTDTEVNAAMDKVRSRLAAELNVELR